MEQELYLVRYSEENGGISSDYFTDKERLDECVEEMRRQHPSASVHVNKAVFCFDGYLVAGEYVKSLEPLGDNY